MVKIGFYLLTGVVVLMVLALFRKDDNPKGTITKYLIICSLWTIYIILIAKSGLLENFGMPPRFPLLIVIPALTGILLAMNRKKLQPLLLRTPLYLPLLLQSFRIFVEILIYGAFLEGVFPQRTTFEGLNYDILVGASAGIVAFMTFKKIITPRGILFWNIASLCILSLTVYSFVSSYYFSDYLLSGSKDIVKFPYLLLVSFLLPAAIFLHIFSIKQVILKTTEPIKEK